MLRALKLDFINDRIKALACAPGEIPELDVGDLMQQKSFGKIIVLAGDSNWQDFLDHGFSLEAVHKNYFRGRPGYYLARYPCPGRGTSRQTAKADRLLADVLKFPASLPDASLPPAFSLRDAGLADIPQLVELYKKVFTSYPVPITDQDYMQETMQTKNHFKIILHRNKIVSAASAEMDANNLTAELTDCASLPEYRGRGLMSKLIQALEEEMRRRKFISVYTIARATGKGINLIFRKQGYEYGGRFINNCTICGSFEDMNLWHKKL
ncbi:MAG: putative beta-lysine N-acetyltransferase [Bacillota bacterium]